MITQMQLEPGDTVFYIDVHKTRRRAVFVERVDGVIAWRRENAGPEYMNKTRQVFSNAGRYKLEDGHIVQIPDGAWDLPGVKISNIHRVQS